MVIDTKKENLCINQIIGKKSEDIVIEGDVIIPDVKPDILSAINTNGTVCVYKKEIMDGKIRLDGSVNLYIMYMPDNSTECIRSVNTSLDFTQIMDIDDAREGMSFEDDIKIKSIECKVLNGRKVNIKVVLNVSVKIFSNDNMEIISQIENNPDMQILNSALEVNSLIGSGITKVFAKENISVDNIDEIAEIMKIDMNIRNRDIKISYNKILAKSDLDVKIMYLTEDNRINVAESQIPIMGFVDIPNVSENNICDTRYCIKNFIAKPNNNETRGIQVEAQIEISCAAYEKKEMNIIQDLYSPNREVRFSQKTINAMMEKENIRHTVGINEQVQIPEIMGHRLFDVEINPVITGENRLNDKIVFDGNLELKFIYEAENSAMVDIKILELPFNTSVEIRGINRQSNVNTNIEIQKQDFIIGQNGSIECRIDLMLEINVSKTKEINIIDDLNEEECEQEKNYSMVIYFVKQGDTLWEIAKKFKSTVEDIVEVNGIQDPNKISIGQQLFIPKYSKKKSA